MLHIRDGFPDQRQIILDSKKRDKIERTPYASSLIITDIGHFPETHYHFVERPHGAGEHIMIFNLSGKGWVRLENKLYTVSPNQVAFLPAGLPHAYGADDSIPWNIYWMHVSGKDAKAFSQRLDSIVQEYVFDVVKAEPLIELFEAAIRFSLAPLDYKTMTKLTMLAHQILGESLMQWKGKRQASRVIEGRILRSIHYMQESLDKNLSLEELARVATLSIPHYSSLFKSHTGSSPLRFFTRLRLQKACRLMEDPGQSLEAIAFQLGFNDSFYFGRIFKKYFDMSPSRYRKEMKNRSATT